MSIPDGATIARLAEDLAAGRTTSLALVEHGLKRIAADPRAVTSVYADRALADAAAADDRRRQGRTLSPLDGIPLTIKDNMDVADEVTAAGSMILRSRPPAQADAAPVARLRRSGAVILAKTHMPEFALASIGTGIHHETPPNALDPDRVPGGSSSGAAITVARGVVAGSLGTDTGGSVTIPASVNGLVGYKPTASLVPLAGIVPLSRHLDTVGSIARSVACCRTILRELVDDPEQAALARHDRPVSSLRLAMPTNYVLDDLDPVIAAAFEHGLDRLSRAGASVFEVRIEEFEGLPVIYEGGGFAMPEVASWLQDAGLSENDGHMDPRVAVRIAQGRSMSAVDMLRKLSLRRRLADSARQRIGAWDAVIFPTTPIPAPRFCEVSADEEYHHLNLRLMRNTRVANILDLCAVSLPLETTDPAIRAGLLVTAPGGSDGSLLDVCAAIEGVLARPNGH